MLSDTPPTPRISGVRIAHLSPENQAAVRSLIFRGLEEHWGTLDPTLNPDLHDLCTAYQGQLFLVVYEGNEVIGCGALIHEGEGIARIVRMSVAARRRRLGIGQLILWRLVQAARQEGYRQIVLETTETWQDAVSFYAKNGFRTTHYADGDRHFVMDLA